MKLRWKVTIGLVAIGILAAVTLSRRANSEQRALEQTRRNLRAQGFKIDLAEFDFSTTDEHRARVTALTNASLNTVVRSNDEAARRMLLQQVMPEIVQTIGPDSAVAYWKHATWAMDAGAAGYPRFGELPGDVWPALREGLGEEHELLDRACLAALEGPIRIPLNASRGNSMLLPHLAAWKNLTQILSGRAAMELHDGNLGAAWTNVLAATRLVTAWETEPAEVSCLVRVACTAIDFNIIWQALQTNGWADEQLSQLQREWESVDFFKLLPETASFARASAAGSCQQERKEAMDSFGPLLKEAFREPKQAWANLNYWYQHLQYRRHGSYDDEKDLLLYYRDREIQLKKAVIAQTWSEMQQLLGVTNQIPFRSRHFVSRVTSLLNSRAMMMSIQGQGQGLLGRTAEAEVRRRVIITAIALERFHKRHGNYPKSLAELSPGFLKTPLVDFIDGKSLRYRLTDDGHFVLYSVGLDGVDDGGTIKRPRQRGIPKQGGIRYGEGLWPVQDLDLVWPRPATADEVQAKLETAKRHTEEETRLAEQQRAADEKETETRRHATVQKLLTHTRIPRDSEPTYDGKPLSQILLNQRATDKTAHTLDELLTLKQTITGKEPDIAIFEVPISYDVITNIGALRLLVDVDPQGLDGPGGELQSCKRATNGNCLLVWNTAYDPSGQHALQAQINYTEKKEDWRSEEARGPVLAFYSSNICQFVPGYSIFSDHGAVLYAKLSEPDATYSIEIKSRAGTRVKTLTGSTSNGVISVEWDLKDDRGQRYTNDSFESTFHVTLTDSGKSQTQKGQ